MLECGIGHAVTKNKVTDTVGEVKGVSDTVGEVEGVSTGLGKVVIDPLSGMSYLSSNPSMIIDRDREEWVLKELIKNELGRQKDEYGEKYNSIFEAESFIRCRVEEVLNSLDDVNKLILNKLHFSVQYENGYEFAVHAEDIKQKCIKSAFSLLSLAAACEKEIDN